LLIEGAERGVIQQIASGGAHSFFVPEEAGLLSCGSGTFGQLGLIDCRAPSVGVAFDEAVENEAMVVLEQLVPNAVCGLADGLGLSLGSDVLQVGIDNGTERSNADNADLSFDVYDAGWGVDGGGGEEEEEEREEEGKVEEGELDEEKRRICERLSEGLITRDTSSSNTRHVQAQFSRPQSSTSIWRVRVAQISAGERHSVLVTACGRAFSCGDWSSGALGLGPAPPAPDAPLTHSQLVFSHVRGLTERVISGAAGGFHTVFLVEGGEVWTVGAGNVGQLGYWLDASAGNGDRGGQDAEIAWEMGKAEMLSIAAVSAGSLHSLFLDFDGGVWACGSGKHGRLGLGNQKNTAPPAQIYSSDLMVAVSAGEMHSLFLSQSGRVKACGNNKFGQLGVALEHFSLSSLRYHTGGSGGKGGHSFLTYPGNVLVPVYVWLPLDVTIMQVAAGNNHSVFLTNEGDAWTSGCNYNGQLGLTEDSGWDEPTPPPSPLPRLKGLLEVKIAAIRNLPKMDLRGSCDGFCELAFQAQRFVTSVKKNKYHPDFGETFSMVFSFDEANEDWEKEAGKGEERKGSGEGEDAMKERGNGDGKGKKKKGLWGMGVEGGGVGADLIQHVSKLGRSLLEGMEGLVGVDIDGDEIVAENKSALEIVVRCVHTLARTHARLRARTYSFFLLRVCTHTYIHIYTHAHTIMHVCSNTPAKKMHLHALAHWCTYTYPYTHTHSLSLFP